LTKVFYFWYSLAMLFGGKDSIGLDIGSSFIKAVKLKESKGSYELDLCHVHALPPELIVDGSIIDSLRLVDSLKEMIKTAGIKAKNAAIAISGHSSVIIKRISLPEMSEEELSESIKFEAEQYVPFDIDDVNLDFQIIGPKDEPGQMDVILVAVKKDKITDYTSVIKMAGKNPALMDVDAFAPRLSFFFNSHSDFFEEIAKFRAARRMWAKIMRDRFKAKNPRSMWMRFHAQTAGVSLTAQQPYNNVIRVTTEALAAVLGGAQSLHTNSLDEVLALPSNSAVKIALRTQQIIAEETGVINTIDPLAGSYFIESLTNKLEEGAWDYIQRIDDIGGMLAAIERGFPQTEISNSSYKLQQQIDHAEKVMVGVNKYVADEDTPINTLKIEEKVAAEQISRLREVKRQRDGQAVLRALNDLRAACKRSDSNIMPFVIDAVKAYATEQ